MFQPEWFDEFGSWLEIENPKIEHIIFVVSCLKKTSM